ncbi:MAG TPA: cupin domain-containing protein [Streptosporangiaceae bacterium]|jgi:quercetin dioxygenase-like cupin family protein|nr:cupin domain-containing protein [Streptosporangiaceae bacterium]
MARIKFVRPEDVGYVRVRDLYDESSESGAVMLRKIPEEELSGQETRFYFPGSPDELQMFEVRCEPDTRFNSHAHIEDEIMYVLSGEIRLGRRAYPAGSAIYIPGGTLYGFHSGPEGLRFLNFRARQDTTYITREDLHGDKAEEAEEQGNDT